jgi:16S rRNA (uracil1498-N3)-methyltransferase
MRIPRIHTTQALRADETIALEAGPSHYLSRVLRQRIGASIILFDGSGGQYPATITALEKKSVVVASGAHDDTERESPLTLHLGIAISRGERMDLVVQKATELGVSSITPLLSERTEVKLNSERELKKLQHWRQIVISACEQCGRNRLPLVANIQMLDQWVAAADAEQKLVMHPGAGPGRDPAEVPASAALLVGPEGGLTEAEVAAAKAAGFTALQMGPRTLRTETAPLAAIAILQARWGDMLARS